METQKKEPLLSPILRWFMFAMVLANTGSSMYPMLMPIYLTELGASITEVGLIFTLTSAVVLVLQLFGGWVSDSIGRLRSIAIGSVGGILGFVAVLLAPSWPWMLAALCVLQFPRALVGPSFGAFIAENSSKENRGKVYGVTDTIFQITGVVGPPIGGLLVGRYGFKVMLLVAGSLYTLAAGLRIWMASTVRLTTEANPKDLSAQSLKTSLKTMFTMIVGGGVLTWIFLTDGVNDTAFRLSGELMPLYLDQLAGITVEEIGILGAVFSIAMMMTPLLSGKIGDKFGERVPISFGFLLVFFAFIIFLNVNTVIGFGICWAVFGFGVGLFSPAYQSLISKVVPQALLGTFTGLFRSSIGFIALPAPYIGAYLWERFSPQLPFIITAAAALVTIIPTWLFFKVPEGQSEPVLAEATLPE
jgi:MFS family permease